MALLNDPIGYDEDRDRDDWSPAIGFRRAALRGLPAAVGLSLLLAPPAALAPYLLIPVYVRAPLAFGVMWLMLWTVKRAAGMVGPSCTALAFVFTLLALTGNQVIFAVQGVPSAFGVDPWWVWPMGIIDMLVPLDDGVHVGWQWLHPYTIVALNAVPMIFGAGVCALFCGRT